MLEQGIFSSQEAIDTVGYFKYFFTSKSSFLRVVAGIAEAW